MIQKRQELDFIKKRIYSFQKKLITKTQKFYIFSSESNDFLADILKLIFEFCSIEDLIVFSTVNKFWYQQLNHDSDF